MTHQVQWTAAAPVWEESASSSDDEIRGSFRQPSILRFATDTFMEDFLGLLDTDASRLAALVTQPENWRRPGPPLRREPIDQVTSFARTLERFRLPGGRVRKLPAAATGSKAPVLNKADPTQVLKLYQPAHQRHYLVASCLVCRQAGLPDRALDTNRDERVTFVMRRLLARGSPSDPPTAVSPDDPTTYDEHAFVTTAEGTGWQKVIRATASGPGALVPGEDQLPLFSATYLQDDGRKRRLLAGTVPVGRREAYMGGAPIPLPPQEIPAGPETEATGNAGPVVPGKPPLGPREVLFRTKVTEPWKQLIGRAQAIRSILDLPDEKGKYPDEQGGLVVENAKRLVTDARLQAQSISWYVLLDFARYLELYLPDVWTYISKGQPPAGQLSAAEQMLVEALEGMALEDPAASAFKEKLVASYPANSYATHQVKTSLTIALKEIAVEPLEKMLDAITTAFAGQRVAAKQDPPEDDLEWPSFLFPLADPGEFTHGAVAEGPALPLNADPVKAVNELVRLVDRALPTTTAAPMPPGALAAQPIAGLGKPAWFVIRCVYERPRCGPLEPTVISEPTRAFQLAGFFDPDAPARPIRIAMPEDTSLAGLRKFDKNTAFMISDILCGQIGRVRKLTLGDLVLSVLPWPFHKDLPEGEDKPCDSGMVCSFSLPDVTLCALLLLFIFVTVLESIFHWLPWFFTCFSLPGFKAKET